MTLLDLDPSTVEETPTVGRCRSCHHKIADPVSLAYGIGPDCRERLGISPRRRLRLARVRPGGDCEGQTDILEET
ncbi:DUF6011 domain-containing protein [Nonomuraea typhae]|uniref:DUF6011 domain-containing protein n=1 Tax=Nonomuraea typhae TaxID=2603600 RepID=UPI0012F8079C|nr:DUF6011 domain-containing protein [Nonomuraea typhae]